MLKAALNGRRAAGIHPALPTTAEDLAVTAAACVAAGAAAIHMHPRDSSGRESLDTAVIDAAVRHVRTAVSVPIGVSTGAWIEPDPESRAAAVARWDEPDMASVNLSEIGARPVMEALLGQGIGVEAGIWSVSDVRRLADTGLQDRVVRILVEIINPAGDPEAEARAIDDALDRIGAAAPRLHHGEDDSTWPVLRQAKRLGRDIRIGLEDTLTLPDGSMAPSNRALVRAALAAG
ncbi:MAG: 3-keto-5-aminohexanoate cleavage protein [Streptosporangiaceae bacterium]